MNQTDITQNPEQPQDWRVKNRKCIVDGCERKHFGRGYCKGHWQQWKRHGAEGITEFQRPYPKDKEGQRRRQREYSLKGYYQMSSQDMEARLEAQDFKCVCGAEVDFYSTVDHDHACCSGLKTCGNCIRGILCNDCNLGIGIFKDDPTRLRLLADYLEGS